MPRERRRHCTREITSLESASVNPGLETLTPSDPDYDAIMAGTLGLSLGAGLLISMLSIAIGAAVQGVVAANLRIAVLGEKPKLSEV